jgi:purine-binding chemotaxis protein CheW
MVDLAKIRKKAKKKEEEAVVVEAPLSTQHSALSTDKLAEYRQTAGTPRPGFIAEDEEKTSDDKEVLTFVIAGEQYAVGIDPIVEIIKPRPITRIPNADSSIVGIISLRGTIVTIVDVRSRLRHPEASDGDPRIIVARRNGEIVGFEVDRVLRVVKSEEGEIEPHPVVHVSEQSDAVRGVFRQSGALTILLDLDKLLG